jgi:AraC-like DNA-binding protein
MHKSKVFHSNRSKGFFVDHVKRINHFDMQTKHCHSQYEIYYLLSGDRNYFIHDRVYKVQKGDLILVNSNVLHKTVDGFSDSHERMLIEFDMSFFDGFLVNYNDLKLLDAFNRDSNLLRLEDLEKKQLENCLFKIIQESKENNIDKNIALKVYLLELLVIINKFHNKISTMEFDHPSELHKKISEVINYINVNYMYDIGLESAAGRFFISTAHLSRAFKRVTGFTFVEYLNNFRIKEAQKLLAETAISISEVGEKVGYQNSTHFGRVFKSITGSSPRDYRKLL